MSKPLNPKIFEFILANVGSHEADLASVTAIEFGISRATANNYIKRLVENKTLEGEGNTRSRRYKLVRFRVVWEEIAINDSVQEDVIWREYILPEVLDLPDNVRDICQYGFTEMLNNVIDHSESGVCEIWVDRTYLNIIIAVRDFGIGVFEKIYTDLDLLDRRHAILELSKGKLTTDEAKHSGEGIFFTSRMFESFTLDSRDLVFLSSPGFLGDWLMEVEDSKKPIDGTLVEMEIAVNASHTIREIYAKYTDNQNRFSKTHVPITLVRYEGEQLVSRSQAKRLLTRVDRFEEVLLDFRNVEMIGQAFADEVFRVFAREHSRVNITPINLTPEVKQMIDHALANAADQNQLEFALNDPPQD